MLRELSNRIALQSLNLMMYPTEREKVTKLVTRFLFMQYTDKISVEVKIKSDIYHSIPIVYVILSNTGIVDLWSNLARCLSVTAS